MDRRADFAWLRANQDRYAGEWVALSGGRLLGHAPTLAALRRLVPADAESPLIHRIAVSAEASAE